MVLDEQHRKGRTLVWETLGGAVATTVWDKPVWQGSQHHLVGRATAARGRRFVDDASAVGLLPWKFRVRRAGTTIGLL